MTLLLSPLFLYDELNLITHLAFTQVLVTQGVYDAGLFIYNFSQGLKSKPAVGFNKERKGLDLSCA